MKKVFTSFSLGMILFGFAVSAQAQTTVFLKPSEALKLIFKDSQEVIQEGHPVTGEVRSKAGEKLKYDLPKDHYTFYVGKTNGHIDGYALIDEQVGKVQPITFLTRISPEGKVDAVEVMVYRESHGGEVASRRFLNQFRQKTLNDELRLHGDIINVTGATLSSGALVTGVKRALVLWQIFYGKS
jgi:H+/Na+-translocating ferredoxin:NAD+ oxidoreductase subunit G